MYDPLGSPEDANALCTWIRHTIGSAHLEYFCVSCESETNARETHINFDSLVSYLGQKHASTLRFLHFQKSFLGADGMRHLCESCVNLEELSVMTSIIGLVC